MAEAPQPCCERAREGFVKRLAAAMVSYPVIKSFPCPTCKRIVQIRLYAAPEETVDSLKGL